MSSNVIVIPLSGLGGEYVTLIDAQDEAKVRKYNWRASKRKSGSKTIVYAIRSAGRNDVGHKHGATIYLHRYLMDAPASLMVDHKNRQTLDNTRSNLRLATRSQNAANSSKGQRSKYGRGVYKVTRENAKKPFFSMIRTGQGGNKRMRLGYFRTAMEAAVAYDQWALKLYGEFAILNYPRDAMSSSFTLMAAE